MDDDRDHHGARQQPLPFDEPLPFDDEAGHPVQYALTARARREVAPEVLPDLAVVRSAAPARGGSHERSSRPAVQRPEAPGPGSDRDGDGALERPGDTRPARARALRRAGLSVHSIGRQLGVDELVVRAWTGDVRGEGVGVVPVAPVADRQHDDADDHAHAEARARAATDGRRRLAGDPTFAAGLGMMAALAEVDGHGVRVATTESRVAGALTRWLVAHAGVPTGRIRVVLRLGRLVVADRARHRWAQALDLPLEQIVHTRARDVGDQGQQAVLRASGEQLADAVAGWREALLEPSSPEPLDAAF